MNITVAAKRLFQGSKMIGKAIYAELMEIIDQTTKIDLFIEYKENLNISINNERIISEAPVIKVGLLQYL